MAKRVITAREQYELAEPFLRHAEADELPPPPKKNPVPIPDYDNIEWEQDLLPQPEPLAKPEPVDPGHFHPGFKSYMDGYSEGKSGFASTAWGDYHKSPESADWWHNMWKQNEGNEDQEPVKNPDFLNWMNEIQGEQSWKDYHADDQSASDYHKLYEEDQAPLPPKYKVDGPKNQQTSLVDLLKGYSGGDLNYSQATKAVNTWIQNNPDTASSYLKPSMVGHLKELLESGGKGLYGDFVDLLDKDNHAKLTDNHQYDPHTGEKVKDGGTDEDAQLINNPFQKLLDDQQAAQDKPVEVPSFYKLLSEVGLSEMWAGKISQWSPEKYNQYIQDLKSSPTDIPEGSVADKILKWHESQQDKSSGQDSPGFNAKMLAQDVGKIFNIDPELIQQKGVKWKDMTPEQAQESLQELQNIYTDKPELDHLYDLHFGTGGGDLGSFVEDAPAKSKAEQIAEHFAPAGFQLKTEDQFFADHVPGSTPVKGIGDYKPKTDAEWEKFFEIAAQELGYGEGNGFSETLKNIWKNVSDSDWKLNLNSDSPIGKAWKKYHDENFGTPQGLTADLIKKHISDISDHSIDSWVNADDPQEKLKNHITFMQNKVDSGQSLSDLYTQNLANWKKIYNEAFGQPHSSSAAPVDIPGWATNSDMGKATFVDPHKEYPGFKEFFNYNGFSSATSAAKQWQSMSPDAKAIWITQAGGDATPAPKGLPSAQQVIDHLVAQDVGWKWDPENPENSSSGLVELLGKSPEEVHQWLKNFAGGSFGSDAQKVLDDLYSAPQSSPAQAGTGVTPPKNYYIDPGILESDGTLNKGVLNYIWDQYGKGGSSNEPAKWLSNILAKSGNSAHHWKPEDWKVITDDWKKLPAEKRLNYQQQPIPSVLAQGLIDGGHVEPTESPGLQKFLSTDEDFTHLHDDEHFKKWFNKNHPDWDPATHDTAEAVWDYQNPWRHEYPKWVDGGYYSDKAKEHFDDWASYEGPEQMHEWAKRADDGGEEAQQSFNAYLYNQGVHVHDKLDAIMENLGEDAEYIQHWKSNLPPEAIEFFENNPYMAQEDYYDWERFENGDGWHYQATYPDGPNLVNYDAMDASYAPDSVKQGPYHLTPGFGAFLLSRHPYLHTDDDLSELSTGQWNEVASDWRAMPDTEKKKFVQVTNKGTHPTSEDGKFLLQSDHQKMVTSPEFKAWFKKTNNDADLDSSYYKEQANMLYNEPDNTWTQQKVNGFQKYLAIKNDPEFQQYLKSQGYGPEFGLENPYTAVSKWNKVVADWEMESDKPAPFNANNLVKMLRKIDPEFWDDYDVYSKLTKYGPDWHKKNLETLIAQGEKGEFPPEETEAYKKLYNKYFSEPMGQDERPDIMSSPKTPKDLLDDEGSLIPEFQQWLWDNKTKDMSPQQFLDTVSNWKGEHWVAAGEAFKKSQEPLIPEEADVLTSDDQSENSGSETESGPAPLDVEDILAQLHEADSVFWNEDRMNDLRDKEWGHDDWKGYIKSWASGDYPTHEQKIYDGLLAKYFGDGNTPAKSYTPEEMVAEISDKWPASGSNLSGASVEDIKKKLEYWATDNLFSDSVKNHAKMLLNKFFNSTPVIPPGVGDSSSPPPLRKPPTIEREIKKQLNGLIDKLKAPESDTIYNSDDVDLARSEDFQQWFSQAPEDYRKVVQQFPYLALDDYHNGKQYNWVPEDDGPAQMYKLFHAPEADRPGGKIRHPSGEVLQLPGGWGRHWPGHTKNPEAPPDSERAETEFKPRPPSVPGQLEIPLGGGSSWEPEYKYPEMRRGINIHWDRYKPNGGASRHGGPDHHHLLSLPGEEGERHRAAAQMLDEIKEMMIGLEPDEKRIVDRNRDKDRKEQPFQPTLFDGDGVDLPEGMPKIPRNGDYGSNEKWMDLFAWGQQNQLTPEQMWLMAKKGKIPNADKWGTPPLSYLVAQAKRDPRPMARRVGELIGNPDWADNNSSLTDVEYKLRRMKDNSYYGESYDKKTQMEAAHLYDKWFGKGFLDELLAHKILDYLETGGWKPSEFSDHPTPGGMGPHWTTKDHVDFGDRSPDKEWGFPVQVVADWPGLGEDPDSKDGAHGFRSEKEVTKNPGTPMVVKKLKIRHPLLPDSDRAVELPLTPHIRYAAQEPLRARKQGRSVLSHRERFAYGGDWDDLESPWDTGQPEVMAQPKLTTDQFWQNQHRMDSSGRIHFPPNGLNPPSNSPSRPDIQWQNREPAHPRLSEDMPQDRVPQSLFRGMSIDLKHPDAAPLHRLVFGHHPDDDHLFDLDHSGQANWNHPQLGHAILDHLESNRPPGEDGSVYGLGPHWTTDPMTATDFALSGAHDLLNDPDGLQLPIRLIGDWKGLGEDPYRSGTDEDVEGQWADENEMTLLPGAGMNIRDVQIMRPNNRGGWGRQWESILREPQFRHAALTPLPMRPRTAKRIISQREWLEG